MTWIWFHLFFFLYIYIYFHTSWLSLFSGSLFFCSIFSIVPILRFLFLACDGHKWGGWEECSENSPVLKGGNFVTAGEIVDRQRRSVSPSCCTLMLVECWLGKAKSACVRSRRCHLRPCWLVSLVVPGDWPGRGAPVGWVAFLLSADPEGKSWHSTPV